MGKPIDLTGQHFGTLKVIERAGNDRHGNARWVCRCEVCGREVVVRGYDLRNGGTRSCGLKRCRERKPELVAVTAPKTEPVPREATLCWDCKNAVCGCSWSERFEPVEGWEAVATQVYNGGGKGRKELFIKSFLVLACPLFVRDDT